MWSPADPSDIPAPQDVILAKEAISKLEIALKAAEDALERVQVDALTREIETRRAWLAPIRRLPVEILSDIFIFCRDLDYFSPLTISKVNRMWRQVILSTLHAWSTIHVNSERPYRHVVKCMLTYIERSDPCFLHVFLPERYRAYDPYHSLEDLERLGLSQASRLQSLSISVVPLRTFSPATFPNLTRLLLGERMEIDISFFDSSRFPQLRILVLAGEILVVASPRPSTNITFPRLQFLGINDSDQDSSWITLVQQCSTTLQGLSVYYMDEDRVFPETTIYFPKLEYLMIWPHLDEPPHFRSIDAVTPSLRYYVERRFGSPKRFTTHTDLKTVIHLRVRAIPSLEECPSLHTLQIMFEWPSRSSCSLLVQQLEHHRDACPSLSHIEFYTPGDERCQLDPSELMSLKSWVEERIKEARPHVTVSFPTELNPLPGSLEDIMCGFSMPYYAFWKHLGGMPSFASAMWSPTDPNCIPSPQDIIMGKEAISKLEITLKTAEDALERVQVDALTREIETLRAWLAPIRRLPVEILSDIFLFSRDLDHFSPLTISHVNRMWRQVILSTLHAWSTIHVNSNRPYQRVVKYMSTYIERSDPCFLHVFLPERCRCYDPYHTLEDLERLGLSQSSRLQSLSMSAVPLGTLSCTTFPNLTRLFLGDRMEIDISFFDSSRFPQLRILVLAGEVRVVTSPRASTNVTSPPLQFLGINDSGQDSSWITLVQQCSTTLQGLSVSYIDEDRVFPETKIHFPKLEYLVIRPHEDELFHLRSIDAVTPSLRYYVEERYGSPKLFTTHTDLKTVIHLRVRAIPSLEECPSLQTLQILFEWPSRSSCSLLVQQLEHHRDACPSLSHIEFYTPGDERSPLDPCEVMPLISWVEKRIKKARPHVTVSFPRMLNFLPGSLDDIMCGFPMPYGAFWMREYDMDFVFTQYRIELE
ncbi:hypothetical protein M408DRAFT_25294 [Serendipita vermifera MAFF 305830]|uniref:F-box domain-containing protein n=1 Tax=Serendipita vermifera MAFF 305830 TaxID=933852 RepID=A0A0C3APV1_SERVB|nr:hypothetical protein M408DRAFT_25294 [Serendipita vermifera MAFF 305830]